MAKEKDVNTQEGDDFKKGNLVNETGLVEAAMADLKKDKDEKKVEEIKCAIARATYVNSKVRAQLRARRREDNITKEKLTATKELLEQLIGFETEIKDGCLEPTKTKCKLPAITPSEFDKKLKELNDRIAKKIEESNRQLEEDLKEIRNSYEHRYANWWDDTDLRMTNRY